MIAEIPLFPSGDDSDAPDLARLLAGDDRSSSALITFVRRAGMFQIQPLNLNTHEFLGVFYERLRNIDELMHAVVMGSSINSAGVPLHEGLLVGVEIKMFPSFFDAPNGEVPMPDAAEMSCGNHSVIAIGLDLVDERLPFWHLFSPNWGNDGRGRLSFEYLRVYTLGAGVMRRHGGPEPEAPPAPNADGENTAPPGVEAASQNAAEKLNGDRLLYLMNHYRPDEPESKWVLQHEDDDVIWVGRRLISAGSGDVLIQADILIRGVLDKPMLVGWMTGRISGRTVDIEEFFVWPPYRRRGLGTALAGRTLFYAAATGASWVRWIELADDAIVNERLGGGLPRWASDFEWIPAVESVGWSVTRTTHEINLAGLLNRLGNLHVPGGVHLIWSDGGVVSVAPHPRSPELGLVLQTDVPMPD